MMKLLLATFLVLFTLSGYAQNVLVIDDFEDLTAIGNWNGTYEPTDKHSSHGTGSIVLESPSGSIWLENEHVPADWSRYEVFKFDVYNPSDNLYFGNIQIFDKMASDDEAEMDGQSYRGRKLFLNAGWNHFEFLIQNAKVEEGDRHLATDQIRKVRFAVGGVRHPVYFDNFRLVAGKEPEHTQSLIQPAHCIVTIDNRYVYPQLAEKVEEVLNSQEIVNLRVQAHKAVESLEREIEIAEMQGFQSLYERIPLIAASVGMGIRSKLVWFQNEKEEMKMLNHIIKSCNNAVDELHVLLSAQKSSIPVFEPENDASPYPFYVPPFPPLKELEIKDGFYRDLTGKPVFIFSMLQVNEGPLMDYFAPFNHRIESYTVGGGSRYDIEESPVYQAYHKHDDAKRVGWDGWCGHLIKDRWAMGGKKENVVICLESDNIKEAVLEFMQMHYPEWVHNPNLLYNIMAYELQYICYCDKSQQMFREWLIEKYGNINHLNDTWETNYTEFAGVEAPPTRNARPLDDTNRAAWYDWANFNTRRFTNYLKWVKDEMLKLDPHTPVCAGGTHSMLSSSNSVTGIDEEMIINEVNDVILNESGGSPIFSDLLSSLSETPKVMVDPEMGGSTHNLLLHFLHGKSDISKWWWASSHSKEYHHMNQSSIPHSKDISLGDVEEVLRIGLDVRRLGEEIASFTQVDPEIAILYSKSSMLQVPPAQVQAGTTPYIDAIHTAWEGSRFLGARIGFVSEKQVLDGKLDRFKLVLIPAVKYTMPEVADKVLEYVSKGGTAVVMPETFLFDQYARENNMMADFNIKILDVTVPDVVGVGERIQNYDQSFSQKVNYENIQKEITVSENDVFDQSHLPLNSTGIIQTISKDNVEVLAQFEDGNPALVRSAVGNGRLYYLATTLSAKDLHHILAPIADKVLLKRPFVAVDVAGDLVVHAEVRAVERTLDYLVYASNLSDQNIEFKLKGDLHSGTAIDLRSMKEVALNQLILAPFQESIFKIRKPVGKNR